jgi:hypothetical protein
MKKVIVLMVAVASYAAVQAQVSYGAKGGFNISNVRGSDVSGNKAKLGIHFGGYVAIPVTKEFSVQPELVFSTQGDKVIERGLPDSKININYLNIPVMAKYTTESGFFGETGPQLGFLLNAKEKAGSSKTDIKDSFKKVDLSWALGVGYLTDFDLGINLRYNFGISKLDKDGEAKVFNSVFQAGVFYKLGSR